MTELPEGWALASFQLRQYCANVVDSKSEIYPTGTALSRGFMCPECEYEENDFPVTRHGRDIVAYLTLQILFAH
jgi:hypothetical protein